MSHLVYYKSFNFFFCVSDLVPKENLTQWLKYLRNEFPAVAFKASTQIQSKRLGHSRSKFLRSNEPEIKTSMCLGADTLMTLLGNYARNKGMKTAIRVGVVGIHLNCLLLLFYK